MNPLIGIWLVMRLVSFALMAFILVFMIGGHGLGATGRAIAFMEPSSTWTNKARPKKARSSQTQILHRVFSIQYLSQHWLSPNHLCDR